MTSWWSVDRIKATINQSYVERELASKKHQDLLHRVLSFGDGLTDDTYLDWIVERSSRFFLVLNDIGVPEKIFEIIDRSFDDDDLPLSQDALWELNLFGTKSETLDKKFYRQQYSYLVQELEPGGHVEYGTWEVVPVQTVAKRAGILATNTEKVAVNDRFYTRKKISNSSDDGIDRIRFIMHLKSLEPLHHKHIAAVWATYSQDDFNYALLTPCLDITLKTVLDDQSKQIKGMEKHKRRQTLLIWVQCLTSAVAYLHNHGLTHRAMRPSTITVDQDNMIYLNEFSALKALDCDDAANIYSGEIYEYAPPENWLRKSRLHETAPSKILPPGGGRTSRRIPKSSPPITENVRPPPFQPTSPRRTHSKSQSSSSASASSTNQRSRNALITTFAPSQGSISLLPNKNFPADVFSLTAVLLSLLSYLLGHSPKSFASHRSRLNRQAGRGNATPDSSFHKNLKQVDKWIDMLAKEAGQKEKKDLTYWGAVGEVVGLCRSGMQKESTARGSANELAKKAGGWVNYGLNNQRKCGCFDQHQVEMEQRQEMKSPPNQPLARRESTLSWGVLSSKYSEADLSPPQSSMRPRRSLSQRKSLDRRPGHHRSGQRKMDSQSTSANRSSRKNSDAVSSLMHPTSRKNSDAVPSPTITASRKASDATASPGESIGREINYEEDNPHEHLFGKPETVDSDSKIGSRPGSRPQKPSREESFDKVKVRDVTHAIGRAVLHDDEQLDTMSMTSYGGTEVWGLGNALEDDEEPYERADWPLPVGALSFAHDAK